LGVTVSRAIIIVAAIFVALVVLSLIFLGVGSG
jgi:hypothetical protein